MKKIEKANFYLTGMFYDDSLLQSYRLIFMALEAILFGFALALFKGHTIIVSCVAVVGIFCGILWICTCHHRGREVWAWRDKALSALANTEIGQFLAERWKGANRRGENMTFMHGLTRIVLNYLFPAIVIVIWILILLVINWRTCNSGC